jgi:hypothetical protein
VLCAEYRFILGGGSYSMDHIVDSYLVTTFSRTEMVFLSNRSTPELLFKLTDKPISSQADNGMVQKGVIL